MITRLCHIFCLLISGAILMILFETPLNAQQESKGSPPANVSAAEVKIGMIAPQAEFIGTVYYQEVSDVASEIEGLVEKVHFEEGQRIEEGQILVELGSDLILKRLQATKSSYEQVLSELQIARIEFERRKKLFKKQSISESSYDENRFRVKGLEKRAAALKYEMERIQIEFKKKRIAAPFSGVVIKRHVDRGEWLSEGETVAVLGKDDVVDIVAEIPEQFIPYVETGREVTVRANSAEFKGQVIAIVPKGDIGTRTFPVKIRTPNRFSLIEGMSAKVMLPTAKPQRTLIVPRDAVISPFGQPVVYTVNGTRARMRPVTVVGYEELNTGVQAAGLEAGMKVIVKGHERVRDGQPVSLNHNN